MEQGNMHGSKGGAVVRAVASHQCGLRSNPGIYRCHVWVEFVVAGARGFSLGTLVFPSQTYFPNSNSTRNQVNEEPLHGCPTSKSLFKYLFYLFIWVTNSSPFF